MTIKIEAGKYYRTRDGRKVGPMLKTESSQFVLTDGVRFWDEDGFEVLGRRDKPQDLIAEWTDTPNGNGTVKRMVRIARKGLE